MTKQQKTENNHEGFKTLILGFVTNILEKVSDNVTHKVQVWTKQMQRRAIGSVVAVIGFTYFLTGLSDFTGSLLEKDIPGLGYIVVGLVSLLIGYLVSRK